MGRWNDLRDGGSADNPIPAALPAGSQALEVPKRRGSRGVAAGTVASFAEHAYEMDRLELPRTGTMSAASALATDRSMLPIDPMNELQERNQND